MAGHIAYPVQQRAREVANLPGGERALAIVPFPHRRIPPFAVRRENRGQPVRGRILIIETSGVGVGERLRHLETHVASAPVIVEPYIEQVRTDRQLHDDAGLIEKIAAVSNKAFLYAGQKALRIMIAEFAEAPAFLRSPQNRRLVIPFCCTEGHGPWRSGSRDGNSGHGAEQAEHRPA